MQNGHYWVEIIPGTPEVVKVINESYFRFHETDGHLICDETPELVGPVFPPTIKWQTAPRPTAEYSFGDSRGQTRPRKVWDNLVSEEVFTVEQEESLQRQAREFNRANHPPVESSLPNILRNLYDED